MLFYLKQKTFIVKSYKMLDAGLYIVATPIGNIRDLSPRGIDVLQDAEIIAAEDTRISKKLFSLLGISTHKFFITYEDHSEQEKFQQIIDFIRNGKATPVPRLSQTPDINLYASAGSRTSKSQPFQALVPLSVLCSFLACRPTGLCLPVLSPTKINPGLIYLQS